MNYILGRNRASCNKDHIVPVSVDSYQKYLLDILPVKEIQKEVDQIRNELDGDYNACHIRRTDIETIQKKYSGVKKVLGQFVISITLHGNKINKLH